jgi:hypothetical protein
MCLSKCNPFFQKNLVYFETTLQLGDIVESICFAISFCFTNMSINMILYKWRCCEPKSRNESQVFLLAFVDIIMCLVKIYLDTSSLHKICAFELWIFIKQEELDNLWKQGCSKFLHSCFLWRRIAKGTLEVERKICNIVHASERTFESKHFKCNHLNHAFLPYFPCMINAKW